MVEHLGTAKGIKCKEAPTGHDISDMPEKHHDLNPVNRAHLNKTGPQGFDHPLTKGTMGRR